MSTPPKAAILFLALTFFPLSLVSAEDASVERLRKDVTFLASDACEGRGVGTKGLDLAAEYIRDQFLKSGLKPAGVENTYFQPFSMTAKTELDGPGSVILHGPQKQTIRLKPGTDFNVIGLSGPGKLKAPLVFVGHGVTAPKAGVDYFKGLDLKGKLAVAVRRLPRWNNKDAPFEPDNADQLASLENKQSLAELNGAAGLILVNDQSEDQAGDPLIPFAVTAREISSNQIPYVQIRRTILDAIFQSARNTTLVSVEKAIDRDLKAPVGPLDGWSIELDVKVKRQAAVVKNVLGVLPGAGPLAKEIVVVGAHYDHLGFGGTGSRVKEKAIHHGADDNASGTSTVLELARRFSGMKDRQGRTLLFMTFTAEEMGLIGSKYYVKNPIHPLGDTVAMVNLDMVGRVRNDEKTGKEKLIAEGLGTSKDFETMIDRLNPGFQLAKKKAGTGPSDHDSFYRGKVPVVFLWTGLHPEYHKPSDKSDLINVEGMKKIADFSEKIIQELATVPSRPNYIQVAGGTQTASMGKMPVLKIRPDYQSEEPGVKLEGVEPGGPGDLGGLKAGDLIVEVSGKSVRNLNAYMTAMMQHKIGEPLVLTVERAGKKLQLKVIPK